MSHNSCVISIITSQWVTIPCTVKVISCCAWSSRYHGATPLPHITPHPQHPPPHHATPTTPHPVYWLHSAITQGFKCLFCFKICIYTYSTSRHIRRYQKFSSKCQLWPAMLYACLHVCIICLHLSAYVTPCQYSICSLSPCNVYKNENIVKKKSM